MCFLESFNSAVPQVPSEYFLAESRWGLVSFIFRGCALKIYLVPKSLE